MLETVGVFAFAIFILLLPVIFGICCKANMAAWYDFHVPPEDAPLIELEKNRQIILNEIEFLCSSDISILGAYPDGVSLLMFREDMRRCLEQDLLPQCESRIADLQVSMV